MIQRSFFEIRIEIEARSGGGGSKRGDLFVARSLALFPKPCLDRLAGQNGRGPMSPFRFRPNPIMKLIGERDVQILQWHVYYYVIYCGNNPGIPPAMGTSAPDSVVPLLTYNAREAGWDGREIVPGEPIPEIREN